MSTYDRLLPATAGCTGPDVSYARRVLRIYPEDGPLDASTMAAIRGLQTAAGLDVTGLLDRPTWDQIKILGDRRAGLV